MGQREEEAGRDGGDQLVRRIAAAEINGRRVNEAIERGGPDAGSAVFVCECGFLGCNETIQLTNAEYESVRSGFNRFLVVPGHEMDDVEDVVERHPNHLVVAKRDGEAEAMAQASDERST